MCRTVLSRSLGETYIVYDNHGLVDGIECPIDETPLVSQIEYESYSFLCYACGTHYSYNLTADQLRKEAKSSAEAMERALREGYVLLKDVRKLEKIVEVARNNGVFTDDSQLR